MMKDAVLIFARNLNFGKVKTRIAATGGNDLAFSVYNHLLKYTAFITKHLPFEKVVFYSTQIDRGDIWDDSIYQKQVQIGNDLGERMYNALFSTFKLGCSKAIIIGTDCLELTADIILNAFELLNQHETVIGPAKDGGYYLIGMKNAHDELFRDISWSTDKVLEQTIAICDQLQLSRKMLNVLSDIDDENDLRNMNKQFYLK
ncbi:MAG: glycosyltransferase [Bacteroidetes bacterium]|nr:MAG: glycosyltransferase [Bacteroidota bacterium]